MDNQINHVEVEARDGDDEIIYSGNFNIYDNKLSLKAILGFNFTFIFETSEQQEGQNDISIKSGDKTVTITLSKKVRNSLGGGTTKKHPIVMFKNGNKLLYSLYASSIGDNTDALNVVINFYLQTV